MSTVLTVGPQVGRFFETYFTHPKGAGFGTPFHLEPWQQDFVDEFYRVDEQGTRLYRHGMLGIPRGNGKTPLAAGIGLWELMSRPDAPEIFNVAGSKDQAALCTEFARAFSDRANGKLKKWLVPGRRAITHKRSMGVMSLLSSDGSLQHGKSPSAFIADELHAFVTEAQVEVWTALWTALHKRHNSFALAITTAGFDKETLLGQQYDDALATLEFEDRLIVPGVGPCLRIGRDLENGTLFWWYAPPDHISIDEAIADERIWRAVNPASWVSLDELRKNLHGLGGDEYDFARLHLNMWTQSRDVFIPAGSWKECRSDVKPKRGGPIWVAVDVGLTHDTTAVAFSQPVAGEAGRPQVVSRVRVWSANPQHERDGTARHQFIPGKVDLEMVLDYVWGLCAGYQVKEVVYDPTFFEGEAQRLAKKGVPVAPVHQNGVLPAIAYQQFYIDVKQGNALHADDPVYTRHVLGATGVKTERGWRVSELRSSEAIDALQAASMSHWRASRQIGSVYETRGLTGSEDPDADEADDEDWD